MKERAKKKPMTGHMMGKHCGYTLYADGSIQVAPTYSEPMNNALKQEEALNALLAAVTERCHALMVPIVAAKESFWQGVKDDYGIDLSASWSYNKRTRILSMRKANA